MMPAHASPSPARGAAGFTLIEVMVTVAIVATLAAIAYPSYTDSVLKGRRGEARAALTELMQQQERYMTQNNAYKVFASTDGVPFNTTVGASSAPSYRLSAEKCDDAVSEKVCIRLVAAPTRADAQAGNLRITSNGVRDCTGTANGSNPKLCWP
jgi:type IV pilus assembly protein PilE